MDNVIRTQIRNILEDFDQHEKKLSISAKITYSSFVEEIQEMFEELVEDENIPIDKAKEIINDAVNDAAIKFQTKQDAEANTPTTSYDFDVVRGFSGGKFIEKNSS